MRRAALLPTVTAFAFAPALCGSLWACGGAPPAPATAAGPAQSNAQPSDKATADVAASGPPAQLDCGDFSTCAISESGAVRCWGRDKSGELGDGGGDDRTKGVTVRGVENATAIALASQFGCALGADKKVKCWGTGRIANDGAPKVRARPTDVVGLSGVEELVASGTMACARSATGISCWGSDAPTIGTPPKGAFVQVATGFTHACALDKKGAVTCWGAEDWAPKGAFSKPAITGATFVATGDRHACVVTKDKKIQCWGLNDAGQLGKEPDGNAHKTPVVVPGVVGAVKVIAGESATCALLADGSARCWGANGEGELGLGKKSSDERPTKVGAIADVVSMCLASSHGCALTKSKTISCWGGNASGQLGDGTKDRKLEPSRVAW